jgi:glycosyltransferase involved in cell wall biosynthesis
MIIKHSIIVICYNQENYIRKALDSVLCEQVKPYEIIIGDDCSTDGTIEILKEYKSKYPEIINLILNKNNLGIFENLNNVTPKATGDIISFLAGDDWYMPSFLENMNKKIEEFMLNPRELKFILLPNTIHYKTDGSYIRNINNSKYIEKYTPVGAVLRDKIFTRMTGLSRALFDMSPPFPKDANEIGLWADRLQHILFAQYIDKQIILDCDGPAHLLDIGIVSKTSGEKKQNSYYEVLKRIRKEYDKGELKLCDVDARYLDFHIKCCASALNYHFYDIPDIIKLSIYLLRHDIRELENVKYELYRMSRNIFSKTILAKIIKTAMKDIGNHN